MTSHSRGPLLDSGPTLIGIELGHCSRDLIRASTKIFLEDRAILIDDECHDAGIAIGRRINDDREAASHLSVSDVVLCAAFRRSALFIQHREIVAVKGLMLVRLELIS